MFGGTDTRDIEWSLHLELAGPFSWLQASGGSARSRGLRQAPLQTADDYLL